MTSRKSKKQKQSRNLSGLRNQPKASPAPTASSYNPTPPRSHAPSPEGDGDKSELEEDDLELLIHFDSMKMNLQHEDEHYSDLGDDEGDEGLEEWSGFHSQDLADAMGAMIKDDDPTDLDWMPSRMRKELLRMEKMKTGMDFLTKRILGDTEVVSRAAQGVQEGTRCDEQSSQDPKAIQESIQGPGEAHRLWF